jgi:hypothetical protein
LAATCPAQVVIFRSGRSPLESPQKEAHTQSGDGHVVATAEAEEHVQQKEERDDAGHDAQRVWSVETAGRPSTHEKDSDGDGDQGERDTDRPRQPCRRDVEYTLAKWTAVPTKAIRPTRADGVSDVRAAVA